MKTQFLLAVLCATILSSCEKKSNGLADGQFEHDGMHREYIFYKPANIPTNAPLVFALHGYTSTAEEMREYTGMNRVADEHGFAVCYPQGALDFFNTTHWNARMSISNIDDVGFLTALAKYLQDKHNLDPARTYSCGFSNGGFMSYTLACERSDVFKAIASVSGTMSGSSWESRNAAEAFPVLHIHGTADEVVPIDGSMDIPGGWGGAPHMDEVMDFWRLHNQCQDSDTLYPSNITTAYRYHGGVKNNQVWYYKIENWGHEWPTVWSETETGIIASDLIWDFFSLH